MKAWLAYLGLFIAVLAGSAIVDCSRRDNLDKGEVYNKVLAIEKSLNERDSCVISLLDSIRGLVPLTSDTLLYDNIIECIDEASSEMQDGDNNLEIWYELDELKSGL